MNRTADLDAANPAVLKLTWGARWNAHREASTPMKDKSRAGCHYHILTVRVPGGSQQIAECWEGEWDLGLAQQYLDEVYLHNSVDEGWMRSGLSDADGTATGATRSATYR
ncbi:hypothetical protein [Mycobacterium asiaticum]|uniref:hypothetical protein n=1 Tax=Mycobacterium asiaticum TaxID=1790 RepID=UPI00055E46AC|nr:hypothetical protein [Mycobacterium asiaticum]ORA15560.1 hypothetical protein BST16_09115 [Mycobacterium asiaticum DSM 44297]